MPISWRHTTRRLAHSTSTSLICVLLLRISLCFCFIPATVQYINSNDPKTDVDRTPAEVSTGEILELDHEIGRKDAAAVFKATVDKLITSE